MWKDGYLDEYRSYHVSEEQKLIWRSELTQKLFSQLELKHDSTLFGLCTIINSFGEYELLETILDFISNNYNQTDSFLKIRYSEYLFDILENSKIHQNYPPELIIRTKKSILEIINNVLSNKIIINEESGKILEFNQEIDNEEYLIIRAENLQRKVEFFEI